MKIRTLLTTYLPLKTGGFGYFLLFLQFFYLYQISAENDVGGVSFSAGSIILILLSMFSVWWFFQCIATFFSRSRIGMLCATLIAFSCYDLLIAYQFGSQEFVEWSFIISNLGIAFSGESFDVILSSLDIDALYYIPAIALLFLPFELWRKSVSRSRQNSHLLKKSISGILIYFALILSPIDSYDPFIAFFRSVIHHHFSTVQFEQSIPKESYPFISSSETFFSGKFNNVSHKQPHIFLIVCESLNASVIGKVSSDGKEITPFLNQLRKKSVYVDPFYGNSIQTAKGHFATYFSGIPSLTGKTFVNHKNLTIKSLASVLSDIGYHTLYFNAHNKANFDNTAPFMLSHGYKEFKLVQQFLKQGDNQSRLKWGVEDQVFFKRFFDYYDEILSQKKEPLFITMATIANHFPFTSVPENRRLIYADPPSLPKGITEHYANSIHLTDFGLSVFFEGLKKRSALKNSLIIITGDHAFPLGEHGNYNLEAGYHEESFRIPFFIVWDGVLTPQRITNAASQIDIGPTIIDLLTINNTKTSFQGQSIFSKRKKYIPLIQPYGKHLSIIHYPIKYRYNTRLKKEYAYDLLKDPMETKNIFNSLSETQLLDFRNQLRHLYRFDYGIKHNQIFNN